MPAAVIVLLRLAMWGVGIAGGVFGLKRFTEKSEENYFNNGVCKKCDGHFKAIPGTEMKGSKGYMCDVCNNCVWISFGSDEGYVYTPSKNCKK